MKEKSCSLSLGKASQISNMFYLFCPTSLPVQTGPMLGSPEARLHEDWSISDQWI